MAESVRAALTLVARGEAVLGIVYSTDAKVEPGVKIVGTFPADSHPLIIYPVAATATAKPEAAAYLDFLRSQAAKATLEKYGFHVPDPPDLLTRVRHLANGMDGDRAVAAGRDGGDAGGDADRDRARLAAGAARVLGQGGCWMPRSICRWCCRRS